MKNFSIETPNSLTYSGAKCSISPSRTFEIDPIDI